MLLSARVSLRRITTTRQFGMILRSSDSLSRAPRDSMMDYRDTLVPFDFRAEVSLFSVSGKKIILSSR